MSVTWSIFVSWCLRCGKENRQPGKTVECKCGAVYDIEWPSGHQMDADGKVTEVR